MHERCAHCSTQNGQPQKRPLAKQANHTKSVVTVGDQIGVNPALLSRKEAAVYLGVSEQTLAIWKSTGRYALPVVKVGRLAKYRRSDLDGFLERNTWDGGKRHGDDRGR